MADHPARTAAMGGRPWAHGTLLFSSSKKFSRNVLVSQDRGASWSSINQGLRTLNVWDLAEDGDGSIVAATGSGVHRLRLAGNNGSKASGTVH
jgi:hypothetical protein